MREPNHDLGLRRVESSAAKDREDQASGCRYAKQTDCPSGLLVERAPTGFARGEPCFFLFIIQHTPAAPKLVMGLFFTAPLYRMPLSSVPMTGGRDMIAQVRETSEGGQIARGQAANSSCTSTTSPNWSLHGSCAAATGADQSSRKYSHFHRRPRRSVMVLRCRARLCKSLPVNNGSGRPSFCSRHMLLLPSQKCTGVRGHGSATSNFRPFNSPLLNDG